MHVAAGLATLPCDLLHQRQDRIADDISLAAQQIEIERGNLGPSRDRLRRLRRDDGAARLGLRQRNLDLGVARDQAKIGKYRAHGGRAEGIAEQDGIEDGGRGRERGHGAHRLRLWRRRERSANSGIGGYSFVASLLCRPGVRRYDIAVVVRPRSRGATRPSLASPSALVRRGRREDRVRAAPAVSCAKCTKKTHTSIQVQRRQSGLPCAVVYGLLRALPGDRLVATVIPEKLASRET